MARFRHAFPGERGCPVATRSGGHPEPDASTNAPVMLRKLVFQRISLSSREGYDRVCIRSPRGYPGWKTRCIRPPRTGTPILAGVRGMPFSCGWHGAETRMETPETNNYSISQTHGDFQMIYRKSRTVRQTQTKCPGGGMPHPGLTGCGNRAIIYHCQYTK